MGVARPTVGRAQLHVLTGLRRGFVPVLPAPSRPTPAEGTRAVGTRERLCCL